MTAASAISETPSADVSLVASETSEVPAADINFGVSWFLTHFRISENSFTQNQISQLSHSPNAEPNRSIEITLQQTPASSRQLDDEKSSNAAIETFHSVNENHILFTSSLLPLFLMKLLKWKPQQTEHPLLMRWRINLLHNNSSSYLIWNVPL